MLSFDLCGTFFLLVIPSLSYVKPCIETTPVLGNELFAMAEGAQIAEKPLSTASTAIHVDVESASEKPAHVHRQVTEQSVASQESQTPEQPESPPAPYEYETLHRGKQLRRMLVLGLGRWLVTAALAASIYAVLYTFSSKEALPAYKKKEFNTLVIGLSIFFSLNIASALKHDVSHLRWWLLSLGHYQPRETDLILQSENLSALTKLAWVSHHYGIRAFVIFFLLLNLGSQVALALLGITYNVNPADVVTVTRPGPVSITDMSQIEIDQTLAKGTASKSLNESQTANARRYAANTYGIASISLYDSDISTAPQPGTLYRQDKPVLFYDFDNSVVYYFYEYSAPNASYNAGVATDRSVAVKATCDAWKVISGGDGLSQNITVRVGDGEPDFNVTLPSTNGPDQTIYMQDTETMSGDSWAQVDAFEASRTDPWYYSCNITILPVVNAVLPEHKLGASLTRDAAASIALQGYGASTNGLTNETDTLQWQSYPAQSYFGNPSGGVGDAMGLTMARFAAGTIATTASSNNMTNVHGRMPIRGITLEIVSWTYLNLILGITLALQFLITFASIFIANKVQQRGRSHFAMAALLRPTLSELDSRISLASGKEIASIMKRNEDMFRYEHQAGRGYVIRSSRL